MKEPLELIINNVFLKVDMTTIFGESKKAKPPLPKIDTLPEINYP